jgi:hypothetical protein
LSKHPGKGDRFFIQEYGLLQPVMHGGVGNRDIERILQREGYQPIHFGDQESFGAGAKLRRFGRWLRFLLAIPRGSLVVFQWPPYAHLSLLFLRALCRFRKDVRIICYLTDINGIKDGDAAVLKEELAWFHRFSEFIVHNECMEQWLREFLPGAHMARIDFFDFLAVPVMRERALSNRICFAGLLSKSAFLKELDRFPGLQFNVYGPDGELLPVSENVHYKGAFPPQELPAIIEGSFGLVWDGDSASGPEGPLGHYSAYISPHKLSLYILAGMPIICQGRSAAATLVAKYGIGFSVDALSDVPAAIAGLSGVAYREMAQNMVPLARRLAAGRALLDAIGELDKSSGM